MKQQEEQLVKLYLKDQQQKRKKLILSFFLLLIIIGVGFSIKILVLDTKPKQDDIVIVKKEPMKLELTKDSIELYEGEEIDYKSYIKLATDNKKDVIERVTWTKIDTSKAGTFEVVYTLQNSNKDNVKKNLIVTINEKPKEEQKEIETVIPNEVVEPTPDWNNSSGQENNQVPPTPTPTIPSTVFPQFFSVKDYGSIDGTMNACYEVMSQYGGGCYPIRNASDGEWQGYELRSQ